MSNYKLPQCPKFPLPNYNVFNVQGDRGGQKLGFVDFDSVVPVSAQFCRNGRADGKIEEIQK